MVCFEDVFKLSPLLLGLAIFCGCSQRGELAGAAFETPLKSPAAIAVGFNHHQRNRYQSPISGEWRDGDDIEQMLIQALSLPNTKFWSPFKSYQLQRLQTHSSQPSIAE